MIRKKKMCNFKICRFVDRSILNITKKSSPIRDEGSPQLFLNISNFYVYLSIYKNYLKNTFNPQYFLIFKKLTCPSFICSCTSTQSPLAEKFWFIVCLYNSEVFQNCKILFYSFFYWYFSYLSSPKYLQRHLQQDLLLYR